MTRWLGWTCLLAFALVPFPAMAQQKKRDAIVIFKDGFDIKGKINEQVRDYLYDPVSGHSFSIPSGDFYIDDHVRNVKFNPSHVQKVRQFQVGEVKEPMQILRVKSYYQPYNILAEFQFDRYSKWNEKGERTVGVNNTGKGKRFEMTQKIGLITPHHMLAYTEDYKWDLMYFTNEIGFGPEWTREFLLQVFTELPQLKKLKDSEKFLQIAAFQQEAGWFKEAEVELVNIIKSFPSEKKIAEEMLTKLKKERAELFVERIKKMALVGQHQEAIEGLENYVRQGFPEIIAPALRNFANDLKREYEKDKVRIEQAHKYLKEMPTYVKKAAAPVWVKACEFIEEELNYDTVDRLDEFLQSAQQYETQKKEKRELTQSAEEVLAIGVSSWLQGKGSFEKDPQLALKLVHAREFLLDYLKSEDDAQRTQLRSVFARDKNLPIDVLSKLIRMIPPPFAHDANEINTKIQRLNLPNGGTYLLQLPPDYHHLRSYPVLMVLHSGRDKPEEMLKRFSEDAAKHGFILAAPLWAGNALLKSTYNHSAKEQAVALETLSDLRRRFQVDSDRVCLFGWEDGANLAFDLGLGHPDLFAGVAPMNGKLLPFTRRFYWPNAQYLPFYVIEGDRNGGNAKQMRELFKDWTRDPFQSIYAEYKGRGSEWFGHEIPHVVNWMSRKKRHAPMKEMGQPNFSSRDLGQEFRSSQPSHNRFYWLSSDALADGRMLDHTTPKWRTNYQPATFQASLSVGNKSKKGEADIWNQVNLRVNGMKQVTLWITPNMMSLKNNLVIHVNGQQVGGKRQIDPSLETLLEELHRTGDRQRLFVAKIEIKIF